MTDDQDSHSAETAEKTLLALTEALPSAAVVTDEQGRTWHVNERWLSLSGLSRTYKYQFAFQQGPFMADVRTA